MAAFAIPAAAGERGSHIPQSLIRPQLDANGRWLLRAFRAAKRRQVLPHLLVGAGNGEPAVLQPTVVAACEVVGPMVGHRLHCGGEEGAGRGEVDRFHRMRTML